MIKFLIILAALVAAPAFAATNNTLAVAPEKSSIAWHGTKVTGKHDGTIQLKSGSLVESSGKITGGEFTIDMKSIQDTDLTDANYNKKLITHLKSEDFFDAEKNPDAKFVAKKITHKAGDQYEVSGDLTIKGVTKPNTFVATISKTADGYEVVANGITVDRTQYGIKYGSGKFFQGLGDKLIHDTFTIDIKLAASAPAKKMDKKAAKSKK